MKAIEFDRFALNALKVVEREPASLASNQVRMKVMACSLNRRDLLMVQGLYNKRQPLPLIPLSDGAGVVTEVGSDVKDLAVGDRVTSLFCPRWVSGTAHREGIRHTRGGPLEGMCQEEIVVAHDAVLRYPEYLSAVEASTLPCAALTAWSALFENPAPVKAGDRVLLLGTGGVSIFALQFAKAAGAKVCMTSSSDEKRVRAEALGADLTLNYHDEDWPKQVRKWSGKRGVDHVVEVGGAGTFNRSVRCTRPGGQVHLVGVLAGQAEVDLTAVLMNAIRVNGIFVGSRASFERMNVFLEEHRIHPVIDEVFGLAQTIGAFRKMEKGAHLGKIVIEPNPQPKQDKLTQTF